jgi:hypothetical protein
VPVPPLRPVPGPVAPPKPPAPVAPETVDVPAVRPVPEASVYGDIMARPSRQHLGDGRATDAHESAHLLHADLRNARPSSRSNAVYLLGGKAAYVPEPKVRLSMVAPLVPKPVRGTRFNLYLVQQVKGWDDRSLYVFDEGNAYLLDSKVSLDDHARGIANRRPSGEAKTIGRPGDGWCPRPSPFLASGPEGKSYRGVVDALPEFAAYACAHALAVKKHDPSYWESDKQYRAWLSWYLRESWDVYKAGVAVPDFAVLAQKEVATAIATAPECEDIRSILKSEAGGAWLPSK